MKPSLFLYSSSFILRLARKPPPPPVLLKHREMAPSRQERRAAKRDAAKRVPSSAGAGGGGGAGVNAARADVNVKPLGHWTTQAENPYVGPCGYCVVRHVMGCRLTHETRVQRTVNDVASNTRLARRLGAV